MRAGLEQLLELHGNKAVLAVGAVVRHEVQMVAAGLELVFQNDDILAAEADNDIDLGACLLERLSGRKSDRTADAAADHADALDALGVRGLAERTDEVLNIVALVHRAEHLRRQADLLENNGYRTLFAVVACDGQGDTLTGLIHAEDDELTGLRLLGDKGSLDLHQSNGRIQLFLADNF